MRFCFAFLAVWLLLSGTAAWAESTAELQLLQEFFSQKGVENRSTRLTGAALEEFSRHPMVGEYLPKNATTEFRLLVESETSAIYEAVVSYDQLAVMWSAFFQRGPLGSKLEAIKALKIPPFLAAVEYPRLLAQSGRNRAQQGRLAQLQRLFMATETLKKDLNDNLAIYENIALLVETGKTDEAEAAVREAGLVGARLYGEAKSEGEIALLIAGSGEKPSSKLGSELRISGFLDSVIGLLHLPPGASPPLMSANDYIFIEPLADNWYLFRNIAAEPLKEKSAKNE